MLISHPLADTPWALWIAGSLRAAGHEVILDLADTSFAQRLAGARYSSACPILLLLSAEHRATVNDWQLLACSPALVGRLMSLRLDACEPPHALRALPSRSLHGLDEEDALEIVLNLAGGVRRDRLQAPALPAIPFSRDGSIADSGPAGAGSPQAGLDSSPSGAESPQARRAR